MAPLDRRARIAVAALLSGALACGDDNATAPVQQEASFAALQTALTADCGACHTAQSGRTFQVTMDSAALVGSGLITPANPDQSLLILKPTTGAHGGGIVTAFSSQHIALAKAWIAKQPDIGNTVLTAVRLEGTLNIDGYKTDQIWWQAPTTLARVGGGWADATEVSMKAVYDDTYLYLLLQWYDDRPSIKRIPWVKKADGTWAVMAAKPAPQDGTDWATYKGQGFDEEGPAIAYEDKVAIAWNTYSPTTTTAGFDQQGCAVLCHDPAKNGQPGTTYNYANGAQAAKKYTNAPNEIVDLWHWKMVRQNQHAKIDDQFVRYWVPGPDGAADGGRASDAGSGGYAENPAVNSHPTYRGKTSAPPYYILKSDTVRLTDAELAAMPAGTLLPNMITSGPTGTPGRADIDGVGTYEPGMWTLEIRRKLVTGDDKDVQFDNLLREYAFGIAIFDNAQIEHSWAPTVYKLKFRPR